MSQINTRSTSGPKLVTIGLPLYRRFGFLPRALASVEAQDYPNIELLISDNGENPESIRRLIDQHYSKPYRLRRNPHTIAAPLHFNQLIDEASGDYFMMLCDDDEISANLVSELVPLLDDSPQTAVAFGREEMIDAESRVVRQSSDQLPAVLDGLDFVRIWCRAELRFECWVTNLARVADLRRLGGYLNTPRATHSDNALLLRLALHGNVRFAPRATFRWRVDGLSHGWNISIQDLAADTRSFLRFLDTEPSILEYSRRHPARWAETRRELVKMTWETYWHRWRTIYRDRLSTSEWVKAAFALPPIPDYYRSALGTLRAAAIGWGMAFLKGPPAA